MTKGSDTRATILDEAANLASINGLNGLTIGTLAAHTGMSKSGLFRHFGSNEDLQVATLHAGVERFIQPVVRPALRAPRGLTRVRALFDHWLEWGTHRGFAGGCIFIPASFELDDQPGAARDYLVARLRDLEHEVFCCLFLDSRHRLTRCEELFRGTVDGASVHPREVVKQALARNATAVILAHNHPSGIAEPSQADEIITTRLRDALALVEIRLLDHLIIGDGHCISLAEKGLI